MADRHVVVVDAGTSRARSLMYNGGGEPVGQAAVEWRHSAPEDGPELAREFAPGWLRSAMFDLIASCIGSSGVAPSKVDAVTVTSQRQAVAFLHDDTVYVGPNTDLRAVFEGAVIDEEMAGTVYETTGHLPSLLLAPAKLIWYRANRPDDYARISRVVSLADWIAGALGGETAAEATLACEAGLLDVRSRDWCGPLLSGLGLAKPDVPLVESGAVIGAVTPEAAAATGLPRNTPVIASGADTQCGLLGLAAAHAGQAGVVAGWSAPVQALTRAPVLSPERKTWAGCFLDRSAWTLESTAGDAGNSYRWLAEMLFGRPAFDEMDRLAERARSSEGALALLGASRMDASRLGMRQGGILFPVPLTVSGLGRPHIARAALEGVACAIRANLEQVEELAGSVSDSVAIGGGLTRSAAFAEIVAGALGRQVAVAPRPNVSATGAFLCAMTGLGEFGSVAEAAETVEPGLAVIDPDPLASAEYDDLYRRWLDLQRRLEAIDL